MSTGSVLGALAGAGLGVFALVAAVRSMNATHGFRPGGGEVSSPVHPEDLDVRGARVLLAPGEVVINRRDYDRVGVSASSLNGVPTIVHVQEPDGSFTTIDSEES